MLIMPRRTVFHEAGMSKPNSALHLVAHSHSIHHAGNIF